MLDSLSNVAGRCKDRINSMRSLNEKHLDDFSSESSVEIDIPPKGGATLSLPAKPLAPMIGADPIIKTFFEGKNSNDNYYEWVDSPPRQLSKRVAKQHDRVAIKVYKVKDISKPVMSGRFSLKHHMLEIQNANLVAALKDIVKKENCHLEATETAQFTEPFRPLYFCQDDIAALLKTDAKEGTSLRPQVQLLLKAMSDMFGGVKKQVAHLQSSGLISYDLAWTYFKKDNMMYAPGKDCERIYKIVDTTYRIKPTPLMYIHAKEITFDGEAFAWKKVRIEISPWIGNKPLLELSHYPLEFHPDPDSIKERLTARAKKVLDYQTLRYCMYTGIGLYTDERGVEKHNVSVSKYFDSQCILTNTRSIVVF
jgi:hypothetical protein